MPIDQSVIRDRALRRTRKGVDVRVGPLIRTLTARCARGRRCPRASDRVCVRMKRLTRRLSGTVRWGQRVVRQIRPGVIPKLKVSLRADEYGKPGTALQVDFPPMMTTVVWVEVNLRSALLLESPLCAGCMLLSGLCPQAE